jgi:hypothetical protein
MESHKIHVPNHQSIPIRICIESIKGFYPSEIEHGTSGFQIAGRATRSQASYLHMALHVNSLLVDPGTSWDPFVGQEQWLKLSLRILA